MAELTRIEKTESETVMKTLPPPEQKGDHYVQVMPSSPDGITTVERHEYYGPYGIGYIEIAYREKDERTWRRMDHYGPETWRDEENGMWYDVTPDPEFR